MLVLCGGGAREKNGGRPKRSWLDNMKNDLSREEVHKAADDRIGGGQTF